MFQPLYLRSFQITAAITDSPSVEAAYVFTTPDDLISDLAMITAARAATPPLLLSGLAFIVPLCQRTLFACSPLLARLATHQN